MTATEPDLPTALQHHRAGRLGTAEGIYREILAQDSNHADALHLLALIAYQSRRVEEALRLMDRAIRANPDAAVYRSNLGSMLQGLGRTAEAIQRFGEALRLKPDYVEPHLYLGNLALQQGRWEEAIQSYRRAIELKPDYAQAHNNLGNVRLKQDRLEEAEACFREALRLQPDLAEAHLNLGNVHARQGHSNEAVACFRQAARLKPDYAEAHNNLGNALREQGRLEEALGCLRRALDLKPDFAEARLNLGAVLEDQNRLEEAAECLHQLLRFKPNYAQALNNLGSVLKKLGRLKEGLDCLQRALRLKPDLAEAHNNVGAVLEQMGRWEETVACYQEALRWQPDFVEAHMNLSMAWLLLGDFERGWREYEWRWKKKGTPPRPCGRPLWDGSPLEGRTILLQAEQGLGDTVQFIRYAAVVKERGGRVVFECQPRLAPLFKSVRGVDRLICPSDLLPECDVYAPLLSLPLICRTSLDSIPCQVPYLEVDPGLVEVWHRRIGDCGGRRKVGIVWAGNPDHKNERIRSMLLAQFAPLSELPNLALFALQRGAQAKELPSAPPGLKITNLEEEAGQITDTAAAIMCLDLVIAVDTMVAHLAGALGRPVWLLLPFAPDYRWMLGREDSPWYPTMRLFRQPGHRDWLAVMAQVAEELRHGDGL